MFCSKCGTNVVEGAAFCNACGSPVAGIGVAPTTAPPSTTPMTHVAPAAIATGVAYAGFWLRFVAIIIDAVVLGFATLIVLAPFGVSMSLRALVRNRAFESPEQWIAAMGMLFKLMAIRMVLHWLYFALLESSEWRGTLGKKALGLEVTDMNGNRIDFARASGRFFGKILSAIILWIGFVMAGITEKKQALHDILAGCLVIRKV
jgi:uncharacterized RDD family membrane protein YckC